MLHEYPEGATPIDDDEAEGLIPDHIATKNELNIWEQANIVAATDWATSRRSLDVLDDGTIADLHRRMFDQTWTWAGRFRRTNKNIGVPWEQIPTSLRDLVADTKYQIQNGVYPIQEIAARFHHRLVQIHPFPNGNGRHSRLVADLLLRQFNMHPFNWGRGSLEAAGTERQQYLRALRAADAGNMQPLLDWLLATGEKTDDGRYE